MQKIYNVGLDIAKNVFQVFLADENGREIKNIKLTRGNVVNFFANLKSCKIGIEACGTSNSWARIFLGMTQD